MLDVYSGNEESTDGGLSCSSAPMIVYTSETLVISTIPKLLFQIEGLGDSEGGARKTEEWSPYVE